MCFGTGVSINMSRLTALTLEAAPEKVENVRARTSSSGRAELTLKRYLGDAIRGFIRNP
jgi:hypothetical protein